MIFQWHSALLFKEVSISSTLYEMPSRRLNNAEPHRQTFTDVPYTHSHTINADNCIAVNVYRNQSGFASDPVKNYLVSHYSISPLSSCLAVISPIRNSPPQSQSGLDSRASSARCSLLYPLQKPRHRFAGVMVFHPSLFAFELMPISIHLILLY